MYFKICARCKHYIKKGNGVMWYDQYCGNPLVQRRQVINPVTGYEEYEHGNERSPHARSVNDGSCKLWEKENGE